LLLVSGLLSTAGILRFQPGQPGRATSGATDATALLLSQLLQSDARTRQMAFAQVDQSRSVNTGTVKIQKAYIDGNNIVVAYTFEGELAKAAISGVKSSSGLKIIAPIITLPNQQKLFATTVQFKIDQASIAFVAYFDGSSLIHTNVRQVQLGIAILLPPSGKTVERFNLTVPVSNGLKVINVKQTVVSNGHALTLDRVVISPSETRFYFTYASPTDSSSLGVSSLSIAGQPYQGAGKAAFGVLAAKGVQEQQFSIWDNLLNSTGTWVWKVTKIKPQALSGVWQFTFQVN
jgi:hypothetical protein